MVMALGFIVCCLVLVIIVVLVIIADPVVLASDFTTIFVLVTLTTLPIKTW